MFNLKALVAAVVIALVPIQAQGLTEVAQIAVKVIQLYTAKDPTRFIQSKPQWEGTIPDTKPAPLFKEPESTVSYTVITKQTESLPDVKVKPVSLEAQIKSLNKVLKENTPEITAKRVAASKAWVKAHPVVLP